MIKYSDIETGRTAFVSIARLLAIFESGPATPGNSLIKMDDGTLHIAYEKAEVLAERVNEMQGRRDEFQGDHK